MEIPTITIDDGKYIYYDGGKIFSKRYNRFVGYYDRDGYLRVSLYGKPEGVHRLIYEKFMGNIPKDLVCDHINNIRDDNRVENLQLLTYQQNAQKRLLSKKNTSGYIGVSFNKENNCWRVQIEKNRKNIFNQSGFKTAVEASDARNDFIDDNPELCKYFIKN